MLHRCPICRQGFADPDELEAHEYRQHQESIESYAGGES